MSVLKEKAKSILAVASITIKMEINVAIKVDFLKSFLFSSSGGTKNKIEKPYESINIKEGDTILEVDHQEIDSTQSSSFNKPLV